MARRKTKVERADIAATGAVAPARDTLAVRALGQLSELADQPPLIAICAATFGWGIGSGNLRLARAGGRMLAAELLATGLKNFVKHRVDRTRPRVAEDGGDYAMRRGHREASAVTSFPSGHTAGAVAVAQAFARDYPEHRLAALTAAGAVAAIQVPRCQHYPSDLAAGAMVGIAAEGLIEAAEAVLRKTTAR